MADIKFTAFIDDVKRSHDGVAFVLKTSEQHRRKVNDQWTTESRTYRDVRASRDSGITLDSFTTGDRVEVAGTEKTEERPGADGKKYRNLVVWASSITPAGQTRAQEPVAEDPWTSTGSAWPGADIPDDASVPF